MKLGFGRRGASGLAFAACLAWVCCGGALSALADDDSAAQESGSRTRLLSAKEGRTIVNVTQEHERPLRGAPDCSHLVHQIYVLSGFDYPYASSFDLYAGSENFARVKTPQAGDVIVWPGHAGIVLDPGEHSFYSLVRSGVDAEDYNGPYWKSRGKPRFYRYVVGSRGSLELAKARPGSRASESAGRGNGPGAVGEGSDAESSSAKKSAKEASGRTATYGPAAPAKAPASIVIAEGRKQPTSEEVAQGISELSSAAGNVLYTDDPAKLGMPVIVYDQLSVERVEMKRDHGWAHLQVDSRAILGGAGTDLNKRREKVRWEIRRTKSGWEAVAPLDRTYVPRDVAVRVLAARLAKLAQSDGAADHDDTVLRQEAQLAKLLSGLLENE